MTTGAQFTAVALRTALRAKELELADLKRKHDGLTEAYGELSQEMDRKHARVTELEHVEQTAIVLMARLATMGTVIAHDDAARILRGVLEKKQSTPS